MNKTTLTIIIFVCLLKSLGSYGQFKTTKTFSSRSTGGLCSTTYILDSLGYFFYEAGCEGRSRIAMGFYTVKKDTVFFNFTRMDTLPPIISISETPAKNDTAVTITILTRFGSPFKRKIDVIAGGNKWVVTPGNDGAFSVNPQKCDSIEIGFLRRFYRKPALIKITRKNMLVIIGFPHMFAHYPFSMPTDMGNFSMLLKKDGLYNLFTKEKEYPANE